MMEFFYLHCEHGGASAFKDADAPLFMVPESGEIKDWRIPKLTLCEGSFRDYQSNDSGLRLCSIRMRDVLEANKSASDIVQWLEAVIVRPPHEVRTYYALYLPAPVDVLDLKKTIRQDDHIIKPVYSLGLIGDHRLFTYPGSQGVRVIVSEEIKEKCEQARLSGIEFSKVPVVTEPSRTK